MAEYGCFETFPACVASGDLSGSQYKFVRLAAVDTIYLASSGGALDTIGVLLNTPQNGESASIAYEGFTKITVGSAVSAADLLMTTSGATATTATSGYTAVGRALTAGSPGEVIPCQLFPVVQLTR